MAVIAMGGAGIRAGAPEWCLVGDGVFDRDRGVEHPVDADRPDHVGKQGVIDRLPVGRRRRQRPRLDQRPLTGLVPPLLRRGARRGA